MVRDSSGRTVLHHAVISGSKDIVKYIIENGELGWFTVARMPPLAKQASNQQHPTLCVEGPSDLLYPPTVTWAILSIFLPVLGALGCYPILAVTVMSLGNISQCHASAFMGADLLFLAASTEMQADLFLFGYFSVMNPQATLLSLSQLRSDAVAGLRVLEPSPLWAVQIVAPTAGCSVQLGCW